MHQSIAGLDEQLQAALMKPCGAGCAEDILALSKRFLGKDVGTIEDLVAGWNMIRENSGCGKSGSSIPRQSRACSGNADVPS